MNMPKLLRLIILVAFVWPHTSFAQATKRVRSAATSSDVCLTANVAGTLTDAICARGASGAAIKGRTDSSAPCAGCVGEYKESGTNPAGNWNAGSGSYADVATLTLTAGWWKCWGSVFVTRGSVTFSATELRLGITPVAGNTASGIVGGFNGAYWDSSFPTTFSFIGANTPEVVIYSDGTNLTVKDGASSGSGTVHSSTQVVRLKLDIGIYASGTPSQSSSLRCIRFM